MKRKLVTVLLALVLVLSFCSVSFAATIESSGDGQIRPMSTNIIMFATNRISATKADVSVDIDFSTKVTQYSVVIYLQKKVNGTWQTDTSNKEKVLYNNGSGVYDFHFYNRYVDLERGASYRIKCVSKDYIGDTSYIAIGYSDPF